MTAHPCRLPPLSRPMKTMLAIATALAVAVAPVAEAKGRKRAAAAGVAAGALLFGGGSSAEAAPGWSRFVGPIGRVRDGDTFYVGGMPIRIADLDCAEAGSRAGDYATAVARDMLSKSTGTAEVWTQGRRSYDRLVGHVNVTERATGHTYSIGAALIANGICKRW